MAVLNNSIRQRRNILKLASLLFVITTTLTASKQELLRRLAIEVIPKGDNSVRSDYLEALRSASGLNDTIILIPFDCGFVDLAANFYVSSIKKHGIGAVLFTALDREACSRLADALYPHRAKCVSYTTEPSSDRSSTWGTTEFRRKNMMKRQLILDALRSGYNVLMSDADVVFIGKPIPDLDISCLAVNCDLAIQWDLKHDNFNGGFIYARNTAVTRQIYERQMEYDKDKERLMNSEQHQLNVAIEQTRSEQNASVTVIPMNTTKYPVGKPFFQKRRCPPSDRYEGVVALHNNYLRDKENKIFRFKECMLWEYDGPDGYYTSPSRKYLSYQYTLAKGKKEYQGLLNAFTIGKILNRTVILPNTFYREGETHTHLLLRVYQRLDMYFIRDFNRYTGGNYRESSFLDNRLVPGEVRNSRSKVYHIFASDIDEFGLNSSDIVLLRSRSVVKGPTVQEIQHWFQGVRESVLQFDSLYGDFRQLLYIRYLGEQFMELVRPLDGPLKFQKYITEGKLQAKLRKGKIIQAAYITKDT